MTIDCEAGGESVLSSPRGSEATMRRLLERASTGIPAALKTMRKANDEIVILIGIRIDRLWTNDEHERYVRASRAASAAHRRYLAECRWFDAVRRRISQV
jgi:hypothetical protein